MTKKRKPSAFALSLVNAASKADAPKAGGQPPEPVRSRIKGLATKKPCAFRGSKGKRPKRKGQHGTQHAASLPIPCPDQLFQQRLIQVAKEIQHEVLVLFFSDAAQKSVELQEQALKMFAQADELLVNQAVG